MSKDVPAGYKLTEVGVIPEDWEVYFLGNKTTKIGSGITPTGGERVYKTEGRPFVRSQNVGWGDLLLDDIAYIDDQIHSTFSSTEIKNGDVFLNITGASIGRSAIADHRLVGGNVNQHVCIIRVVKEEIDPLFLNSCLLSSVGQNQIDSFQVGGNRQGLNFQQIKSIQFAFPQISEQRSIALVLSDTDALITSLDKLIAKKRDIKQAAMQQLLTGKQRLEGFGDTSGKFKQTEIGLIPEDWDCIPLGDVVTEFRGGAPLKPSDFTERGVKVLPKGGVVRGGFLKIQDKDLQFCSRTYAEKYSKNQVDQTYTIVVLRDLVPSGPSIGLIVNIREPEIYVLAQGVYGFKVIEERVATEYLIHYSNSIPYRRLMNEIMVGSTQVHVTNTAFKSARFPCPKIEEQQAIAKVLSDMDSEISALEQRRDKTKALKQAMMQELLTGRIRLREKL